LAEAQQKVQQDQEKDQQLQKEQLQQKQDQDQQLVKLVLLEE
tara:strand:- start:83 stop:208 length:126 start_codon:yes stop_codon:yes gene_type:complete